MVEARQIAQSDAMQLAQYLRQFSTRQGVIDPVEGSVLPHTYTTDFYGWLCARLYVQANDDLWLHESLRALDATLAFRQEPCRSNNSPSTKDEFHWEFKNLALINTLDLLEGKISEEREARIARYLLSWRNLDIDSTNWTAMRALAYGLRHRRFGRATDLWRSRLELELVLARQTNEGFFPDTPSSYSMQYHAYTASLLALYCQTIGNARAREALLQAVRLIINFIDPAGDFNYFGRGQHQLFGYASLILALDVAATLSLTEADGFRLARKQVVDYVNGFRQPDGSFPLVLGGAGGKWGWYDYNYAGDYLAFFAVWLSLTSQTVEPLATERRRKTFTKYYPILGLAVASRPSWFAVMSANGRDLSEPVGLAHLWPNGPEWLGGPDAPRSLGRDYSGNYFGPLVNDKPIMQRQNGTLTVAADAIKLEVRTSEVEVEQVYHLRDSLSLEQTIRPLQGAVNMNWLAVPHIPDGETLWLGSDLTETVTVGEDPLRASSLLTINTPYRSSIVLSAAKSSSRSQPPVTCLGSQARWKDGRYLVLKLAWVLWVKFGEFVALVDRSRFSTAVESK